MAKYLNFVITLAVVNIFAAILDADRAAIEMKQIKWDFSMNAWVQSPNVDLLTPGCGQKVIELSRYIVLLVYWDISLKRYNKSVQKTYRDISLLL